MIRPMRVIYGFLMAAVFAAVAATVAADSPTTVQVRDDCDPATFNAGPPDGPGLGVICNPDFDGETTFTDFIDQVIAQQSVDKWRFNPDRVDDPRTLVPRNRGGEGHTFTRVAQFGGSVVPVLNQLLGNPAVPQECSTAKIIDPGTSGDAVQAQAGDKFQCCIHPWMRTTVRKR
jgi:hypothetical protein